MAGVARYSLHMCASFTPLVETLTAGQTHRVWSVLITVFGDLAQEKGQWISGPTLNSIMTEIGIKPEATRVALHRLRKDGWITSRRVGRHSEYGLTDQGRAQSAQASPRIYSATAAQTTCYLVVSGTGDSPTDHTANETDEPQVLWITPALGLTADHAAARDTLILPVPQDSPLPDWLRARVCSAQLVAASARTEAALGDLQQALESARPLDALQIAVLRVLVVHSWRRIILRAPDLPDTVFPADWRGAACRSLTTALLSALPRPDLAQLDAAIGAPRATGTANVTALKK